MAKKYTTSQSLRLIASGHGQGLGDEWLYRIAAQAADENDRLRGPLEKATDKLQIFRAASDGEYQGGMEYTALMKMIAEAITVETGSE